MELPWNIEDTIENLKELRDGLKEKVILMNKDGRGEKDAEELDFDFNRAIEALERQKPKKPKWHKDSLYEAGKLPVCPTCNTIMVRTEILGRTIDEHCVTCGQAIDWSVNE